MGNIRRADEPAAIESAAEILRSGGVVAFPTETVYGLGAVFNMPHAVARLFELKARPRFDPVIVHVAGREWLKRLWRHLPGKAMALIERFWPGPLTLALPKTEAVPGIVTAGLQTVAVRAPSHPIAQKLIASVGLPLAAPSANRFGALSPVEAAEVVRQLADGPDLILDAGRTPVGIESTVIGFDGETPTLLRPGGLPLELIQKVIGTIKIHEPADKPISPGQLPRHYAPQKPLVLLERLEDLPFERRASCAALGFVRRPLGGFAASEFLSDDGNLHTAAANLFTALSRLDRSKAETIIAEKVPEKDLGLAIMDRLRRGAAGRNEHAKEG